MEILFEDDFLIAVNKPHGVFVHRSSLDKEADVFVLQQVRDYVGSFVHLVHRLDRKTSGVLLLAKSAEIHSEMSKAFAGREVSKKYLAIVRGYTEDAGMIDYAITNDRGKLQDAETHYKTIDRTEINISSGKFPTSRYSLVELSPVTGRQHQLRKHMSHIFHPIIGDRPHGCNKQNKFFLEHFKMDTMLLHASYLEFIHPIGQNTVQISCPVQDEFRRMIAELGFQLKANKL
ncbi:MAG: pseudouridylate synthase [Saprospiraceae bacterium]|nr:pseudouridylate synthase [Saprospiraceae bacterium]